MERNAARRATGIVTLSLACSVAPAAPVVAADEPTVRILDARCGEGMEAACRALAQVALSAPAGAARTLAIQKTRDQRVLSRIARKDADWLVRCAAIGRLEDSRLLASIARKGYYTERACALKNPHLDDAVLLADTVRCARCVHHEKTVLRRAAVRNPNLRDPGGLAALVREDPDSDLRADLAAVLVDAALLETVARTDPSARVRRSAVSNPALADTEVLEKVARTDGDWEVRLAAVKRVSDPDELLATACSADIAWVRVAATEGLEDVEALADLSRNAEAAAACAAANVQAGLRVTETKGPPPAEARWHVRGAASSRIASLRRALVLAESAPRSADCRGGDSAVCLGLAKQAAAEMDLPLRTALVGALDQATLAQLASAGRDSDLRARATEHLDDQALLARMAMRDPEPRVREAATSRLAAPALLAEIAERDRWPQVRRAALVRIKDPGVLLRVAEADPDPGLRRQAASSFDLTDERALARLAATGAGPVREAAVSNPNLSDEALLAELAKLPAGPDDVCVGCIAVGKIESPERVAALARSAPDGRVRRSAVAQLDDVRLLGRLARDTGGIAASAEYRRRQLQRPIPHSWTFGVRSDSRDSLVGSAGLVLGTKDEGTGGWFEFLGSGSGWLLQATASTRSAKLSLGRAHLIWFAGGEGMSVAGWTTKASVLRRWRAGDGDGSETLVGVEADGTLLVHLSTGVFRGRNGWQFNWGIGAGL